MKINIFLFILILLILGVLTLFYFGKDFWSGLKPVILPPPGDITKDLGLGMPEGFKMNIFAKELGSPRVIVFDNNGVAYVSITNQGTIIRLEDKDNDGTAEDKSVILSGLNNPHGIAFYKNYFYVAQEDKIARYEYDGLNSEISGDVQEIIDLPSGGRHHTRTIIFSGDKLYVSIGSTCDVCLESDNRISTIMVMDPDGKNPEIFAKGLRNAVFITSNPSTGDIVGTEMGRDFLGDDLPPDEINIIS